MTAQHMAKQFSFTIENSSFNVCVSLTLTCMGKILVQPAAIADLHLRQTSNLCYRANLAFGMVYTTSR